MDSLNTYRPPEAGPAPAPPPAAHIVFLSHRSSEKRLAMAIGDLLSALGVHYWLDVNDADLQEAARIGMSGEQSLVHAIERGIDHSTHVLGVLSGTTTGSWWVPYEIAYARARALPLSFVMTRSTSTANLPEYVRLAANYWSIDELVRWAANLGTSTGPRRPPYLAFHIDAPIVRRLAEEIPHDPPPASLESLAAQALDAIARLSEADTQAALSLTTESFSWLPTSGGFIRDLAYELFAPIAFIQLNWGDRLAAQPWHVRELYRSPTMDRELAQLSRLDYSPDRPGWQQLRYSEPAMTWLQGLNMDQLRERIQLLFIVADRVGRARLATKEEFKSEFDAIMLSGDAARQRKLGVLINPLLGFTPETRPVFWRLMAYQTQLYTTIVQSSALRRFGRGVGREVAQLLARSEIVGGDPSR